MPDETMVGSDAKGDCRVSLVPGKSLAIEVATEDPRLFERGIREVVEEALAKLGRIRATLSIADKGSLNYVIAARVEAAVRLAFPEIPAIAPKVRRRPSEKDAPRRSRLYAPGNNPRILVGIELHGADCVLVDLEDSVPPAEKPAARVLVKHLLCAIDFPNEVWVRINPLSLGGADDVREVLLARPHGVALPKVESCDDVVALSKELAETEEAVGAPLGSTWIMPIVETAKGVLHAEEIAAADPRVAVVAFGAEDFTRDVGARRTPDALLFARSMIVAAAKAAGVQASDTVYADVDDEVGLAAEAKLARDLGFDGKGAIHPGQVPALHAAFTPSEKEMDEARKIVAAAEEAEARGIGAIAIGGKMIDRPVLERAKRALRLADRLGGRQVGRRGSCSAGKESR
ncbi:MAG: aldolase/citrate lyase family protein [Candidatus Bipolaricaulota bacterium]|nr:aldolase/citrate lyase family protein [Candidatus Bipolaricaulota bacterium]